MLVFPEQILRRRGSASGLPAPLRAGFDLFPRRHLRRLRGESVRRTDGRSAAARHGRVRALVPVAPLRSLDRDRGLDRVGDRVDRTTGAVRHGLERSSRVRAVCAGRRGGCLATPGGSDPAQHGDRRRGAGRCRVCCAGPTWFWQSSWLSARGGSSFRGAGAPRCCGASARAWRCTCPTCFDPGSARRSRGCSSSRCSSCAAGGRCRSHPAGARSTGSCSGPARLRTSGWPLPMPGLSQQISSGSGWSSVSIVLVRGRRVAAAAARARNAFVHSRSGRRHSSVRPCCNRRSSAPTPPTCPGSPA